MKYVKMLGLAAIAAMALTAFVASSASATTLDGPNGVLPAGSKIETTLRAGSSVASTNTSGEIFQTCTAGTLTGVTSTETGSTLKISVSRANMTWSNCSNRTETIAGGELEIAWTSGTNGTVTARGFELTLFTPFIGVTCVYTYGTGTILGALTGGEPAALAVNALIRKTSSSSFLCPETEHWVAEYTVTEPKKLLITN